MFPNRSAATEQRQGRWGPRAQLPTHSVVWEERLSSFGCPEAPPAKQAPPQQKGALSTQVHKAFEPENVFHSSLINS